jgi:hypothetical protein
MSLISKLFNQAERSELRAEVLRAKGTARALAKARRLEAKADFNRSVLNSFDDERWG